MNSQMIRQLEFDKKDIHEKKITLRDGRDATLLVHEPTGHGILDSEFWVKEDFYSEQYRDEFSADSDGERKKSEEHFHIYKELNDRQFNLFKDRLTSQTKYLEIGCAHGGIVSRVNDFGVEECHVVEPNIKDSNFVKYKNPNAIVYNSTFDDVDLQEDYFDIIVAFDVVEHLYNPKDFLKKCFDLLNKNGILLIAIPNHNDVLLSKYDCNEYQKFYYHKAHINYFTTQSIVNLCQSVGFAGYVDSFLDYSFFNNVHWQQNNKPMSSADKAFISDVTKDDDINEFYKRVEREYEDLINSKMLGGALIYTELKRMFSFRHVGITVQDMEKSLKLYRDYFRFQIVWDEIEQGKFIDGLSGIDDIVVRTVKLKDEKGGMIELLEYESHPKPLETLRPIVDIGVSHFAMTVDNLDQTYKDLSDMELIFNAKPAISPDGGAKVCFCRDFDGTLIELVEVLN